MALPQGRPQTTFAASKSRMPNDDSAALLWVNKDATNLHSKKHVAEVNAHVQKRGSRGQITKRTQKATQASSRDSKSRRRKSASPAVTLNESASRSRQDVQLSATSSPHDTQLGSLSPPAWGFVNPYFGCQEPSQYDSTSLGLIMQMSHARDYNLSGLQLSSDVATPIPHSLSRLASHDQMLLSSYLTYLPGPLYGTTSSPVYCPIRDASLAHMKQDSLGLLWVLIALDMFVARSEHSNERSARILQRKDQAYKVMAHSMDQSQDSQSLNFLVGTGSAALAELFFGDATTALMHLGAVDTVIQGQGGLSAVAAYPLAVSIPLLTAFAHRSLLQNNLTSPAHFDVARPQFVSSMRSLILSQSSSSQAASHPGTLPIAAHDASRHRSIRRVEMTLQDLQKAQRLAFAPKSLVRAFIDPHFKRQKPSDGIDQFLFLYNFNIALHDFVFQGQYSAATAFLQEIIAEIETAQNHTHSDVKLSMSAVRCLFISRHAKYFGRDASEGVARAWQAIDSLEIMKSMSEASRCRVYETLSGLLAMEPSKVMTVEDLDRLDIEIATNWWSSAGRSKHG